VQTMMHSVVMKYKELAPFNGCYNLKFSGQPRATEAVLFFHGFPAEQGNKNVDLAEKLADELGLDTYIIHYKGLGKSEGEFSFTSSIEESAKYAEYLIRENGYSKLHLVGHSWGGSVATEVYRRIKDQRGRLVLLAPFTDVREGEGAMELALYFMRHYPHIISADQFDTVAKELSKIREQFHAQRTAKELSSHAGNVLIIHAKRDDIIPLSMNQNLKKAWGPDATFVEIESDHRFFHNRDLMIERVERFFRDRPV
jgi:pimeloyl-ACP methyl ester carboxylesterase